MIRDFELIKKILLYAEKNLKAADILQVKLDGYSNDEIAYNTKLLYEAGFLECMDVSDSSGPEFLIKSITWVGHDFIDNCINDTAWKKTKLSFGEKLQNISISVFSGVLTEFCKKQIG
ncbi:MAG: DUF2513 domain-containing protein [Syntrophaceae bacterium]|nr:DUF2513 domain-containing protein [Syntrophaceae bacterium]